MYEVVWQYDDSRNFDDERPATALEACQLLLQGNREFAGFFAQDPAPGATRRVVRLSRQNVGFGIKPGEAPHQEPFVAFLSCADARVPVELIFGQGVNDLFVVRVVGNVLGEASLGSLGYVVDKLSTVRLLAVMGHTGCGAVSAAVDAYLSPAGYMRIADNLQSLIGSLMASTRAAGLALEMVYGHDVAGRSGYRSALIETTVLLNAALSAAILAHNYQDRLSDQLQVVFGVYDLSRRTVGAPDESGEWQEGLVAPPATEEAFSAFGDRIARSRLVRELLD
jgi:carbonic anhydrase